MFDDRWAGTEHKVAIISRTARGDAPGAPNAPLNFLLSDSLGSTQLATAANGQPISEAATLMVGSVRSGAVRA